MSKAQISMWEEKIVDSFAGGGGASTGIELATGRVVDIAINHDPDAILMHKTNHPHTVHYQASVWDVDPLEVTGGSPVGLLWASPDCKHFSNAGRWPEVTEQKRPQQCEGCALAEHDAYICARWRLSYAVNELKKAIPMVRRTAVENMKCPYHYPASLLGTGVVIMDEIGPWPPKGKGR